MIMRRALLIAATAAATLLAAFFAFVGYHKAFSPLAELAQHRVWTLALPEWACRAVGLSEVLLAVALLTIWHVRSRPIAAASAILLIANQLIAGAVHWSRGEVDALPQNAIIVLLLSSVAAAARKQAP